METLSPSLPWISAKPTWFVCVTVTGKRVAGVGAFTQGQSGKAVEYFKIKGLVDAEKAGRTIKTTADGNLTLKKSDFTKLDFNQLTAINGKKYLIKREQLTDTVKTTFNINVNALCYKQVTYHELSIEFTEKGKGLVSGIRTLVFQE